MKYLIPLLKKIEPGIALQLEGECARLYELIQSGVIKSDNDACELLFDGVRKSKKFSELKVRLIQQLVQIVIQHPWIYRSSLQEAFIDSWKSLVAIKILLAKGHKVGSIDIILRALRQARKYDFHRIAVELCIELQHHFFVIENNERKGKYYEKILAREKIKAEAEEQVRIESAKLFFEHNKTRFHSKQYILDLRKKLDFLKTHFQHDSVHINLYLWNLEVLYAYLQHDYSHVIDICVSAIEFMESRKMDRTAGFRYKLAPAQLILGQYDEARDNIRQAIARVKKEEYSWSVVTYYRLLIELHDGEYEQAFRLFQAANGAPQISRALKVQWRIVKAYMAFLIRSGYIREHEGRSPHYRQIISEIPPYSQDKQGNNVNILILQLLINLGHNNDVLIDRAEAIRKYMQRHMRSRELVRARTFLEMLLTIPRYQFHYEAVIRHTHKKQKLLLSKPLRKTQNQDIEIIPYTELWKMVLHILSKHSSRYRGRNRVSRR